MSNNCDHLNEEQDNDNEMTRRYLPRHPLEDSLSPQCFLSKENNNIGMLQLNISPIIPSSYATLEEFEKEKKNSSRQENDLDALLSSSSVCAIGSKVQEEEEYDESFDEYDKRKIAMILNGEEDDDDSRCEIIEGGNEELRRKDNVNRSEKVDNEMMMMSYHHDLPDDYFNSTLDLSDEMQRSMQTIHEDDC